MAKKKAVKKKTKKVDKKKEKLHLTMQDLNKKGLKIKFAKNAEVKEKITFGIPEIDEQVTGILAGNFHILYGAVSCAKSATALTMIATNQKKGKRCALIDLEHTWDADRAITFGVDIGALVLAEDCETAEDAMEITRILAKEAAIDLIVVDSIQGMSPHLQQYKTKAKTQLREIKEDEIASLAKKMGKFINVTKDFIFKSKVAILLIGQGRTNIGGYGNQMELTGGQAQKYFSLLTLYVRKGAGTDAPMAKVKEYHFDSAGKERFKTVEKPIGFNCVFKIIKHKITGCAVEGTQWHVPFYFVSGFNKPVEVVEDENQPMLEMEDV